MAEYEISHPRIPQIGNTVLKGPDDLPPPTERDFWNVVQQQVRPFGLSQLTDEEKISAYKNGYFDDPEPVEDQPEQPGIVDSLLDLGGKAVLRGSQMVNVLTAGQIGHSGPYDKLLRLEDKALPYEKTENADQFREAGKYLFGFLDNTEEELDFDPVAEALKRTGMPFYSKNKNARGRVKTAAMDYAQDSMVAGMGEGYARAASGGEFLYKGGKLLKDKQLTPTAYDTSPFGDINTPITEGLPDDSDILDYVNSAIEFDALNHRYENSAELAAFVLENPQESAKAMGAGIVGGLTPIVEAEDLNEILIDEEDINLDSDLQQDIRSGFVQPDVGVSFLSEVVGDPMNLAGGTTAKAVTAPQRVALSGRITKTLNEVNRLNKTKSSIAKELQKAQQRGEQSQRISRQARNLEAVNRQLANRQIILDKYGRNSLFLRMAAQSSPDELLKVAAQNIDTASDAGKASMNMVYNAMKPSGKMGIVRKGVAMGARLTPEIAGATIGASLAGPEGAALGAITPAFIKGVKIISTMPENVAISYIMRSATEAGEEITEQAARKQWRGLTAKYLYPAGILGLSGGAVLGSQEGGGGISDSLLKIGGGAFALKFLPKIAQFSDAAMRDSRVIGPELIYARGENSPFFNRLALLPSADEGLIGANADRFQALTRTSSGETILEKAIDKVRPIGRGIATSVTDEFPTGAPFRPGLSDTNKMLSNPTRKAAQFLDRTPTLGRGLETLGRFGTVVTAGSTLPAAFGYVGSGGQTEGALAGAIVSAPFTSIGAGAGMFQTFKNKGDLFQQKMGDVHYYREHLNKSEQADFDGLPIHIRMALSGYSLSHPDVMFQPGTEGQGNFSFNPDLQTSVIEYRKDTGAGLIEGVLAHEIGHKIEIHGLTPMVNKIFFGDPVTKEGGVYGKYNDEGKIEPNQEFLDLRDIYLQKLSADKSINPANADRYQGPEGNQIFASELFADQVKDYLLSGKKDKGNTVAEKIVRASSDAMLGTPFIRDFLLKMNFPMKADGKFIEGGFFEGKQRRIPEITKLIDQYYKDTRAMRQREIQGEEVTTPGTNRVDKELSIDSRKAKRPIEGEDFESSFSIKDQNDPAIKAKLDTGGVFKWRPTADGGSELETGPTGTPKRYTAKELEKQNRAQGDHAIKVFEKNGVDIITHKDGKKSTGDITNLTPEMIDELAQGPWHPRQIQTLREISRSLREGDGERAGFLIGYFAASTGRKPKAVPFALRQEMPYGFKLTKDGNILALLHDVPQLEKNLKFLKGGKRLPGKYRDEYNQLFDNDTEVWEAFRQYRVNTANGMDGQLGLDDDPARAIRKKNFLNALHGAIDTEHINLNPILSEISKLKGMDMFNPSKRQPFGPATKTFRLDRIFDVTRSGNRNSNVNVDRAKKLLIPAYHGTPHTLAPEAGAPLGRFRTSKIGTGEGAQAYGHGLYFAGKQDVAQWYFENLNKEYLYDGKEYNPSDIRHEAAKIVAKHKMDYESALAEVESRLYLSEDSPYLQKLHELVGMEKHAKISPKGSVYKVELAPKDNEYLLYDKTLGEQPKGVQDKLKKFLREQEGEDTWQYRQEQDYRDITNNVLDDMPEAEISRRLKEAGIPGIKYLDGASRSKGEGDYNYVIFDEADVTVTEKLFMPASEAGATKGKGTSALDILKSNQKPEDLPKVPTILEIAKYFEKEFRDPIDYKKSTPEKNRLFEDLIFEEVLYAQELHPEAAGWYDENLSLALSVLGELDPTILKPDNNFIFKSVLAATSDGNKVQPQFDQTWATYNNWKNTGEISGEFVGGDRISNIKNNLLRIEAIYQLMGGEGAGKWLSQKGTISEIRKAAQDDLGYTKAEAGKIGTSELVDEVVPYAVILGPKLGSFFNNLYGDYSTFTMDRWFMRTVGRNTGTQVVPIPPAKLNAAKQRVRDAVNSLTPAERKKIGVTKQGVAGNSAIKASTKLAGYFTKKQNRTGVSAEVDNLRRAANALNKFGKPLKEAPQNGAERRWLRERLETVQSRLRDVGVNLENADLQALLWYNEKEIYEKLGYRSPTGSADYAGAAEALHARKAGKPSRSYAEGTGRVGEIGRSASESVLGEKNPQEVNFLPAGNFSSQPANRIQQQAPAMPGNRFMAPAASAGAKLSERFR